MLTQNKFAANLANALHSTGPKTECGKAVSKMNSLSHGLRSKAPVIVGERLEDWVLFRDGVLASLGPVGPLENELAERVAILSWRLRRITAYETFAILNGQKKALETAHNHKTSEKKCPDQLGFQSRSRTQCHRDDVEPKTIQESHQRDPQPKRDLITIDKDIAQSESRIQRIQQFAERCRLLSNLPDAQSFEGEYVFEFLNEFAYYFEESELFDALCIPPEWRNEPEQWSGWNGAHLKAGVQFLAQKNKMDVSSLIESTLRGLKPDLELITDNLNRFKSERNELQTVMQRDEDDSRQKTLLPDMNLLEVIMRYEPHLSRELSRAMDLLDKVQARREGDSKESPQTLVVIKSKKRTPKTKHQTQRNEFCKSVPSSQRAHKSDLKSRF